MANNKIITITFRNSVLVTSGSERVKSAPKNEEINFVTTLQTSIFSIPKILHELQF